MATAEKGGSELWRIRGVAVGGSPPLGDGGFGGGVGKLSCIYHSPVRVYMCIYILSLSL